MTSIATGDVVLVTRQSWAGISETRAIVLKVGPKRVKVRWLEAALGRSVGEESYVPRYAVRTA